MYKVKTAIYVRVSTTDQDESQQLPPCLELCKKLGLEAPEIIRETLSAYKNPDRDSLKKLEKYDHVVIWAFDRLHRNRKSFVALMKYLHYKGVKVHSVREPWMEELHHIPAPFNDIMVDMMLQVVGWVAESESQARAARVKKAIVQKEGKTTRSTYGKRWGRPDVAKKIYDQVLRLYQENPNRPIREYCALVSYRSKKNSLKHPSVGIVHKTIQQIKGRVTEQKTPSTREAYLNEKS
jgi:DNA invertase Pin-like site-specific DNA recombinase